MDISKTGYLLGYLQVNLDRGRGTSLSTCRLSDSNMFGALDSIIPVKNMNVDLKNLSPNGGSVTVCGTLGRYLAFCVCVFVCVFVLF